MATKQPFTNNLTQRLFDSILEEDFSIANLESILFNGKINKYFWHQAFDKIEVDTAYRICLFYLFASLSQKDLDDIISYYKAQG